MREIKFRGKDLDGVWRHGSLVNNLFFYTDTKKGVPYIFDVQDVNYYCLADLEDGDGFYEMRPETVGQYTGLKDKKGREIYEGDIVVTIAHGCRYVEQVLWHENLLGGGYSFSFVGQGCGPACHKQDTMEVIGNIHDNPELLKT